MVVSRGVKFIENNCAHRNSAFRYPFTMYEQKNFGFSKKNHHSYDNRNINPDGTYEMDAKQKSSYSVFILIFQLLYSFFSIRNYYSL